MKIINLEFALPTCGQFVGCLAVLLIDMLEGIPLVIDSHRVRSYAGEFITCIEIA